MSEQRAVIIGAGPAGLTAAYELLTRTSIKPVVLEKSEYMGGISRTVNHNGNRIDIGGHRFFSKSDRVMQCGCECSRCRPSRTARRPSSIMEPTADRLLGVRPRPRRRRPRDVAAAAQVPHLLPPPFFDYPVTLSLATLRKLGLWRTIKIGMGSLRSALLPLREERTLEHFFINRFGRELYSTFFKAYTEKVWGVPCSEISAEWGAQRIKGLSLWATLLHALRKAFGSSRRNVAQKDTQTSLIEQFLYPKFGPGQMWEEVARQVIAMGGEIHTGCTVNRVITDGWRVCAVEAANSATGAIGSFTGDFFFSTAPIQELMRSFDAAPPGEILALSDGLVYRDLITVGLLVNSLKIQDDTPTARPCSATTGSTSRNLMCSSAGSRSSITGVLTWSPTQPRLARPGVLLQPDRRDLEPLR